MTLISKDNQGKIVYSVGAVRYDRCREKIHWDEYYESKKMEQMT